MCPTFSFNSQLRLLLSRYRKRARARTAVDCSNLYRSRGSSPPIAFYPRSRGDPLDPEGSAQFCSLAASFNCRISERDCSGKLTNVTRDGTNRRKIARGSVRRATRASRNTNFIENSQLRASETRRTRIENATARRNLNIKGRASARF